MLKSVTVTNPKGETLKLDLFNPEASGLIVQKIEGLGPSKANINVMEQATMDGALFSSSRILSRNIVMSLAMMFSPSIEDARLRTYKYFPVGKKISLLIETDRRISEITGYVESNEPDIFSAQEAAQISIICVDPHFYDIRESQELFVGVQPRFEFPFENDSLTDNLLEFGDIRIDTRAVLPYTGDIDTGVLIVIHAMNPAKKITLYNTDTQGSIAIDTDRITKLTGTQFGSGDDILISTKKGDKYARLLRNGQYTNIISAIGKNADWFQITKGNNTFSFIAEEGERNLIITFNYRNAYGGV